LLKNEVHGEEVVRPDEARGEKTRPVGEDLGEGGRHTNIRWGGGWRGVTSLAKSPSIVVNPPLPSGRTHSACGDEMLRVVAPYVAEMLHLKSLSINRVAGVAGFQTMSTCKPHLNSLAINCLVLIFGGFLQCTIYTQLGMLNGFQPGQSFPSAPQSGGAACPP
jgi:hypothetical protein